MVSKVVMRCITCGEEYDSNKIIYRCQECNDLLDVIIDTESVFDRAALLNREESMWRYRELLPDFRKSLVTLGEGWTRIVGCEKLAHWVGVKRLYLKLESLNPTGSFKDRGMSVGVSVARSLGVARVICASTGNTSASLAAYSARAGLECIVLVPGGKVSSGKLFQARLYNAKVLQLRGGFDEALEVALNYATELGAYVLNSINPWRLEGQKTIAFEIWEQLGSTDLTVAVPVGNCGNIAAIWKGFKELAEHGLVNSLPTMLGAQAKGAAPVAEMWERGWSEPRIWGSPETIATAIRIGRPVNWKKAIRALRESDGKIIAVSDEEILEALRAMASMEGVVGEPASAAPIAAVRRLVNEGRLDPSTTVVSIVTGNALKDPSDALVSWNRPIELNEPERIRDYIVEPKQIDA